MSFVQSVTDNLWPILFYTAIILIIVAYRRKLEWQGFGMGIYRTKVGLKLMDRWGNKYRGLIIVLGYVGIGVGFLGMALIMWSLLNGAWQFVVDSTAPPVVTPVIPGFNIPGFNLEVPLITGWVALFALLVIHEFSHGVLARAHRIPVKSSGLLVFGPIAGAFVEPDEKKVEKSHETVQYAISAAGPWSNILTAGIAMLIVALLISPFTMWASAPDGVRVNTVVDGFPAALVGLPRDALITGVDGVPATNRNDLSAAMDSVVVGDTVTLDTDAGEYAIVTVANPDDATKAYLGITIENHRGASFAGMFGVALSAVALWIESFFQWFVLLSLGIGLANLLPIGPLDGGRMLRLAAEQITGNRKRGDWWWASITKITVILLIGLLLFPVVRWLVL